MKTFKRNKNKKICKGIMKNFSGKSTVRKKIVLQIEPVPKLNKKLSILKQSYLRKNQTINHR